MEFLDTTIGSLFDKLVLEKGDKKLLHFKEKSLSWKEINEISMRMAADMLSLNITKGSRIAIWSHNSPLYLCCLFAIWKIGGVAVLVNPSYKTYEMNKLADYVAFQGIFCDDTCISKLHKTTKINFINYIGMDAWNSLEEKSKQISQEEAESIARRTREIQPHDNACMLFTSGTTGGPKGVELSHYQLINVAATTVDAMRWNNQDIFCVSLALFHIFGLSTGILAALFHQGALCFNPSYKSSEVIKCVAKHRCTVLNGVPTMFLSILNNPEKANYDLSCLKSGIIAGSGVYVKDFLNIVRGLPIPHLMQSYGQTEASPSITFSPYDDPIEKRAKSTGKAIPGVEIRIRDIKEDKDVATGKPGEVEIRGFNTMKGYFNLPEQSQKTLRTDGWMKTGDIGYLDEEGYLYIVGRAKEMIIRGGENISPQEIEEIILDMDGVSQIKVFGVQEEVIQESIAACIVQSKNHSAQDIQAHVRKYLADYKVPKYIFFFDSFPEQSNGKVDVKKLKAIVDQQRKKNSVQQCVVFNNASIKGEPK